MTAIVLMLASAVIVFGLGALHLAYTFFGPKLTPRDAGTPIPNEGGLAGNLKRDDYVELLGWL